VSSHTAFDLVRDSDRYVAAVSPYVDGTGRFKSDRNISPYVYQVSPDTDRLNALLALAAKGVDRYVAAPISILSICVLVMWLSLRPRRLVVRRGVLAGRTALW
jgi:hypothetical protein